MLILKKKLNSKKKKMIIAVDSFYTENKAKTIAIAFDHWEDSNYINYVSEETEVSAVYIPGEFYKRELPCILKILEHFHLNSVEAIVIDGYVFLDDLGKYGLGGHLYENLNKTIPIIGVAKTNFATNRLNQLELLRGESKNPLYISSIGIDMDKAKENISKMFGEYRIPKLLKELDRLTKE